MEQKKYFEIDLGKLPEAKTVKQMKEEGLKIREYFTPVSCLMKKTQFKQKDGTMTDPRYALHVELHSSITEQVVNKKMINQTEFTMLLYHFLKPLNTTEIKFTGFARFIVGESDKIADNKQFIIIELFIHESLSPISGYLQNATKELINRLSLLKPEELRQIGVDKFNGLKMYRLADNDDIKAKLDAVETEGE